MLGDVGRPFGVTSCDESGCLSEDCVLSEQVGKDVFGGQISCWHFAEGDEAGTLGECAGKLFHGVAHFLRVIDFNEGVDEGVFEEGIAGVGLIGLEEGFDCFWQPELAEG